MKRRVFNLFAAVSLVMAISVAAMWVRSVWWHSDHAEFVVRSWTWRTDSSQGRLWLEIADDLPPSRLSLAPRPTAWLPIFDCHAERLYPGLLPGPMTYGVNAADWFLILIFSALPAAWLVGHLRRHKTTGLCAKCGYDLRGTASNKPCPECGAEQSPVVS